MVNNPKPLITIDSFKLRVLREFVTEAPEIFNLVKTSEQYLNVVTGEVITEEYSEEEAPTIKHHQFTNDNGITNIDIRLQYQIVNNIKLENGKYNSIKEEFYTFKITSKLLKNNYLKGIDNTTIKTIYEYITSIGFKITFDNFIKSELTDIDYKLDMVLKPEVYKKIADRYKANAKEWKQLHRGIDIFNQKRNVGIAFGIRERASPLYPFMKIYNKELEASYNSIQFFQVYSEIIENLYRWEFTIKNKKHFEHLELNNTLEAHLQLVEFNQSKLYIILQQYHNIHLNQLTSSMEETKKKEYEKMNDIVLSALVEKLVKENHFGIQSIMNYFEILFENTKRTSKYRMLKKVEGIYNHLRNSETLKTEILVTEETEEIFKHIGII